jgi:hypothetical protein
LRVLIDEGALSPGDLAGREGLPALLFRLENVTDQDQLIAVAEAARAWFDRHPDLQAARRAFVAFLGAAMAPLGAPVRVPDTLLEVRNMLANRVEEWKQQWLREGEQRGEQRGEQQGEQRGERRGEQRGEQIGRRQAAADLLVQLLTRRFGSLPDWVSDHVQTAETERLTEWSLRVLDAATLAAVFA